MRSNTAKRKIKLLPVMKVQCATCPFRLGGGTESLAPYLAESALTEASRLCHSTGKNGVIIPKSKNYFTKPHICRGARDLQIQFFHSIGFIDEPTDAAWDKKWRKMCP